MFGRLVVVLVSLIVALPSHAAISGYVMNADGSAIGGAQVAIFPLESSQARRQRLLSESPARAPLAVAESNEKGRFSIEVPKDQPVVLLQIEAAGFAPQGVVAERDDELGGIALTTAPVKRGRITAGGKGVAGARVVWSGGAEAFAVTDAEGRYSVADPSKWAARVTVLHPDYATLDEMVRRGDTITGDADRVLEKGVTVSGRVVGADGRTPVSGAEVRVDGWPAATSGEDGSFTLATVNSKWQSLEARTASLVGARTRGSDLTIRLQKTAPVRGSVTDLTSQVPVAGAVVTLARAGRFGGGEMPEAFVSDAKGNFTIEAAAPGSFTLFATHPAYSFTPLPASIGVSDASPRKITGIRQARVTGTVLTEQKEPLAGARIASRDPVGPGFGAGMFVMSGATVMMSAPDGTFVTRVNPDADIQIEAVKKGLPAGRSATLKLAPGERKGGVVITVPAGVPVTGRVIDANGRPLSGVVVTAVESRDEFGRPGMVMMMGAPRRERDEDLVSTDSDGRFSLRLKEASYDVSFRRSGFATRTVRSHEVKAGARPLEITLEPGAEVSGRVTRGGVGIPGVTVMLVGEASRGDSVETGADGSFRIADLTPGQMFLSATKRDEFIQISRPIRVPSRDLEIEVPPGGRISGRVIDKETKQPVTTFDAGVSGNRGGGGIVMSGPPMLRAFTSDDGTFVLENVPPGTTTLQVNAPGYVTASLPNVQVEEGKVTSEIEVGLERGVRLTGRVTGPDGSALAGVNVRVVQPAGRVLRPFGPGNNTMTDANGDYTIEGVEPGEQNVMFRRRGYVDVDKKVDFRGRDMRVDAQLTTGLTVSGVVVTEGGAPIADAAVSAYSAGGSGGAPARTDQNGAFRIEGLAPGRYTFTAGKQGYPRAEQRDVDVSTGAPVRLVLQSGGTIYGRVIGLSAEDLSRTTVNATSSSGSASASPDANGHYRIEGAPLGTVRLSARVMDFASGKNSPPKSVEVAAGAVVQQDIEFVSGTVVRGRITRAGRPVPNATVAFFPQPGQTQTSARSQADAQGLYEVSGLDDGTYEVMVGDMQRSASFQTRYQVRGSGTFDIEMRSATVRGRVVDASTGQPVEGAVVELRPREGSSFRMGLAIVQTDPSGAFTMQEVGAGSYQIAAEKKGYGTKVLDLTVGDAPSDVEIKLSANAGVALRVVDGRDGRTLGAWVRVTDVQDRVVYDTPPRFGGSREEVVNIPLDAGTYRATITAPGYAPVNVQMASPGTMTIPMTPGGAIDVRSKGSQIRRARLIGADGREYARGPASTVFMIDPSPGTTKMENIAPGVYTLQILGPREEVVGSAQVIVREGQRTVVEI